MQLALHNTPLARAEIVFPVFPTCPCANDLETIQQSLNGSSRIVFDPAIRRVTVYFDPTQVDIPLILSTLEAFGAKPRVISVTIPAKRAL